MNSNTVKKIIIADNDEQILNLYRKIFADTGYEIYVAKSAPEMAEELRLIRLGHSPKPDLIIMDLMVPYSKGVEILNSVKKSYLTNDIPVFVFSNYQNNDLTAELAERGIFPDKYFIKTNITPAQILKTINQQFSLKPATSLI